MAGAHVSLPVGGNNHSGHAVIFVIKTGHHGIEGFHYLFAGFFYFVRRHAEDEVISSHMPHKVDGIAMAVHRA